MNKIFIVLVILLMISSCSVFPSLRPDDGEQKSTPGNPSLTSGVQTVTGVVLEGGDQTPEGLLDTPREYKYQIKLDSGEEIYLTYTAYPPSPATDDQPMPQLTFHAGAIMIGDSVKARGTYDASSRTLTVELETDFIETTPNP